MSRSRTSIFPLIAVVARSPALLLTSGCVPPTLAEFERGRTKDLETMQALPAERRVEALRDRVLRDGIAVRNPVWVGMPSRTAFQEVDCDENHLFEFKCFYLVAPLREHLAQDYLALGDALRERGDLDGAIGSYEDAIHTADTLMMSVTAAARVRAAALRGEEKLWTDRKEPVRAAAAQVLARAEEGWARTPEAEALERQYDELMSQSQGAMQKEMQEAMQAAFGALQQGLSSMQSVQESMGAGAKLGAIGAAAKGNVSLLAAAQRVGPLVVESMAGPKMVNLTLLRDIVGTTAASLKSLDEGQFHAFVGSDSGKQAMVGITASLYALRRGESMRAARKLMLEAVADFPTQQATVIYQAPPSPPSSAAPASSATAPLPPPDAAADAATRLKRLDELHDKKLITDEEYKKQRQRIVEGL